MLEPYRAPRFAFTLIVIQRNGDHFSHSFSTYRGVRGLLRELLDTAMLDTAMLFDEFILITTVTTVTGGPQTNIRKLTLSEARKLVQQSRESQRGAPRSLAASARV